MISLKVGDKVMYVPDRDTHGMDVTAQGEFLFEFEHAKDSTGGLRRMAGMPAYMKELGKPTGRDEAGNVICGGVHYVRPTRPKFNWFATVLSVGPDFVTIEIDHPSGCSSHIYTVPVDDAKRPHTCHTIAKAKGDK